MTIDLGLPPGSIPRALYQIGPAKAANKSQKVLREKIDEPAARGR